MSLPIYIYKLLLSKRATECKTKSRYFTITTKFIRRVYCVKRRGVCLLLSSVFQAQTCHAIVFIQGEYYSTWYILSHSLSCSLIQSKQQILRRFHSLKSLSSKTPRNSNEREKNMLAFSNNMNHDYSHRIIIDSHYQVCE